MVPVPTVSPNMVGGIQGIAVDPYGDYYVSFTQAIAAYDSNWNLVWKNSRPFAGIPVTVNHIGDIEYYDGYLYVPVEEFKSCTDYSPVLIVVYNADTGILVNWVEITADNHEASGAAVVPEKNQVVISSYCPENGGASTLWIYNLQLVKNSGHGSAVKSESTITLSRPVSYIQGISWDGTRGEFLVSADMVSPAGSLWLASGTGSVTGPVFTVPVDQGVELEGVDATTGNAYYAENGYIHGIEMPAPLANTTQTNHVASSSGSPGDLP